MNKKNVKLYNMIFPIWGLILFPVFWIIIIPINFLIDSIVFLATMRYLKLGSKLVYYKKCILKVVAFGFLSDVLGALFVFMVAGLGDIFSILDPIVYEPASSPITFVIMAIIVIITGVFIYLFNRKFSFKNTDIDDVCKHKLALSLAVFTAPYVFLFNMSFLNKVFHLY